MTKLLKVASLTCCLMALNSQSFAADVEIYGRADVNVSIDSYHGGARDGESPFMLNDGASRFGFNINEQINEDWAIRGYLENGFKLDTGALNSATTLFDRRMILAVKSKKYGELGFGRMGSVTSSNAPYGLGITMLDPFETSYTPDFTISGIFATDSRSNNTITYYSPRLAGVQFGATYSFQRTGDENVEVSDNDRVASTLLSYTNGNFYGVVGVSTIMWGNQNSNEDREDSVEYFIGFNHKVTDNLKVYLGAQWFKDWRGFAFWKPQDHVAATATVAEKKADAYGVDGSVYITGLRYKVTGATTLIGSYAYLTGEQDKNGKTLEGDRHRFSVGCEYVLTKRTNLYLLSNYTKNTDDLADMEKYDYKISALAGITHKF